MTKRTFSGNYLSLQSSTDGLSTFQINDGNRRPSFVPTNPVNSSTGRQPLLRESIKNNVRESFFLYAKEWTEKTGYHSSISFRKQHDAYKKIVDLGWDAVPLLLEALRLNSDFWFPALRDITGVNPVPSEDRGNFEKMTAAWIKWGQDANIIS